VLEQLEQQVQVVAAVAGDSPGKQGRKPRLLQLAPAPRIVLIST
jgi:hypothetical protein